MANIMEFYNIVTLGHLLNNIIIQSLDLVVKGTYIIFINNN